MERSQIKLTQSNRKKKKQTTIPTTGTGKGNDHPNNQSQMAKNRAWLFLGAPGWLGRRLPADTADSGCRGVDSGVAGVGPPGVLGPGVEGTRMVAWKAFFKAMVGKGFIQLLEMWGDFLLSDFFLKSLYIYIYILVILDVIHVHPCWEQYWCTSKKVDILASKTVNTLNT